MSDLTWRNERRKLRDLVPQRDNPRQIRKEQAERLVKSWDKFNQPKTISVGPGGEIYDGHQRYHVWMAAYGGDFEVDVRVSSRPLARREWQELTVLLHEGAAGEWDFDALAEWDGVDTEDLLEWGFDETSLGVAFAAPPASFPEYDESVEDEVEWLECPECGHRWPK